MKNTINKTEKDRFIQIAAGGKKMNGEVKRMAEIQPLPINRLVLQSQKTQFGINMPTFNEGKAYEGFLKEKADLRKYYAPYLENHARSVKENSLFINDFSYRKETEEDKQDFTSVLKGEGKWEQVKIPHYVGPDGRWNAFYRTELYIEKKEGGKYYLFDFEAVDYIAEVYVNGRMAGRHEGFFAPFSVNITDYIHEGKNILLVVVKNDVTSTAVTIDGYAHYGDKIYGATHFGYDEPSLGWHHCPAGAGIFGKVKMAVVDTSRITDIFVQPNIDKGEITVHTTVFSYAYKTLKGKVSYTLEGRNFKETVFENVEGKVDPFTVDENYLTEKFTIPNYKLWTQKTPYLYELAVSLYDENGNVLDEKQTHFGMRKFHMDENSTPKGAFYLNNERIILRGTNEMGHLPLCVMRGDYEQLIDDILIAKVANLNFYRMTQRPVHDEIYTYFDMLGMLCQSDFPLFSYLKPSAVGEALKQVREMEIHTRNHPSVIVETFCNETLDKTAWGKEQYNLSRYEIEKFFNAAKEVVEIYNPERVIKYCEGDYAPLLETHGISDFHCYTYWYVSHGMPSGKLQKGYLPPIRPDWMTGCGEFGVDGLDRWELMQKYCPKEWLPLSQDEPWSPKPIAKEQCYVLHGDFFPEQNTAREWIEASREWQKKAIKDYVHILRRRVDYIESTAVHLLIDAWPCGWTKTLVDVDRIPKPAYYAFKEANIPVRISLRRDKHVVYAGDTLTTELYALNDTAKDVDVKAKVSVYFNGEEIESYATENTAKRVACTYISEILTKIPEDKTGTVKVVARLENANEITYDEVEYVVKEKIAKAQKIPTLLGERVQCVKRICEGSQTGEIIFADDDYFVENQQELEKRAEEGCRLIVVTNKPLHILGEDIIFRVHTLEEEVRANNFVARSETSKFTKEFAEMDFKNFYNARKDYQDLTAWFKFEWSESEEILYTFEDTNNPKYALHKKHKMIAALKKHGKGEVILTTLSCLDGCLGCNPALDKLIVNLIEKE
ncbi:MAG: hypothetical protein IKA99_01815 [Clostridia bacterium]|nr:hypothetical protein [Clostridia bacterium]